MQCDWNGPDPGRGPPAENTPIGRAQPDDQCSVSFLAFSHTSATFSARKCGAACLCDNLSRCRGCSQSGPQNVPSMCNRHHCDGKTGSPYISVTILARSIGIALLIRSLDGALIGFAFLISPWIGHPILFMIAKQAIAGGKIEDVPSFRRFLATQGRNAFHSMTLGWGASLIGDN